MEEYCESLLLLLLGAATYFIWSKEGAKKFKKSTDNLRILLNISPKYAFLENGEAIAYSWGVVKSNTINKI